MMLYSVKLQFLELLFYLCTQLTCFTYSHYNENAGGDSKSPPAFSLDIFN